MHCFSKGMHCSYVFFVFEPRAPWRTVSQPGRLWSQPGSVFERRAPWRTVSLRNINDSEQTAKAHDVQIRSQADSLTAQAATRSAKAHDVQIRSQAYTSTALAATRSAKARGAHVRGGRPRTAGRGAGLRGICPKKTILCPKKTFMSNRPESFLRT